MKDQPMVTVITPAYNRVDLIAETIESVLNQDYNNLEYIVLDDGSTDGTLNIIKKYTGRLRWETHSNIGETRTVNRGFGLARGEIIGVVNSDDPLLPGAIGRVVQELMENRDAVVAYPDWKIIDKESRDIQEVRCRDFVSHIDMLRRHHCLPGPGAFFLRKVVDATGGRDPNFCYAGDLDFWFRACFLGAFIRVPEILATFRVHNGSASSCCRNLKMAQEHILVVEKFFNRDNLPPHFLHCKNESFLNAYHAAVCFSGKNNKLFKIKNILRSFRSCPDAFMKRYKYRIFIYLMLVMGVDYDLVSTQGRKILDLFLPRR